MAVLIATTNPGKLREIRQVLAGLPIAVRSLADFPPVPEPEETGLTFAENARLKAEYYAAAYGVPTVGDDSGLVIDALGGRPGVESARYPGATYPDKFVNLYRELDRHPRPWTARFVCAVAYRDPRQASGTRHWALAHSGQPRPTQSNPTSAKGLVPSAYKAVYEGEATVEGEIAPAPRGSFGFGYDPIFYYPPYGCTLGEVDGEKKLAVAHRGKAFRQFADFLKGTHT
jgi:XTP/dITP diphosphohydrolase